jgi:hypothetical protein
MTQPAEKLSALNAPRLVGASAEIEAIISGGEGLYRRRRKELEEAERTYQAERFALLADFDQRAQALVDEREDKLRELDTTHARRKAKRERVLAALATLRDV